MIIDSLYYINVSSQAIRGAGASFGIVTEFVFATHPEPGPSIRYSYTFKFVIFFSHSRWLFESDFVVCRLGNAQGLAKTFTKWQSFISTPNLDRKFASTLTVTPVGIIISGAISFTAVLVKHQLFIHPLLRYLFWYSCWIWCPQYWSSIWSCVFDQSWCYRRLVRYST